MTEINLEKYNAAADRLYYRRLGRIVNVVGLTLESAGPDAKMGDMCKITTAGGNVIMSEVVGFKNNMTLLMPYEATEGIGAGCIVENMERTFPCRWGIFF